MNLYVIFTYGPDEACLTQSIRAIRFADPSSKIAVFDDAYHPIAKTPDCDLFERTWFERKGNLKGRECLMGMMLAYQRALRMLGNPEYLMLVDSDTVVVNPELALAMARESRADLLGSGNTDRGVWGAFYVFRTPILYRLLDGINSFGNLCEPTDGAICRLIRHMGGTVSVKLFKDTTLRFVNGLHYTADMDLEPLRQNVAITCGNRSEINGEAAANRHATAARAMEQLVGYIHEGKPFDWAAVLPVPLP
jgi:hypothetical protein